MKPPMPDSIPPRSRKSSLEQPWAEPRSGSEPPTTFFLSRSPGYNGEDPDTGDEMAQESMYGVQSLDEALVASHSESTSPVISGLHYNDNDNDDAGSPTPARRRSTLKPTDALGYARFNPSLQPSTDDVSSRPLTPFNISIQSDTSLPSSPKSSNPSLRQLDGSSIADDLSNQTAVSEEEEDVLQAASFRGPDGTSQFIMPSIRMPSRRPFTERGKTLGRLKVLLAGAPGSGKTSLIKSMVQACEDIVHIDPALSPTSLDNGQSHLRSDRSRSPRAAISELYASTKPYPSWWSDLEDSRVLRRRRSTGDTVLERNLCFVDTPASSLSQQGQTDAAAQYMHRQLLRATTAISSPGIDLQNMLAGNGGSQVDVILYLISQDTLASDIECIQQLCDSTNVLPVISKADLLSPEHISNLKSSFRKQVEQATIKPFFFGDSAPLDDNEIDHASPLAVSSAKSNDEDTMDASTLMSPDYVQPLVPSELDILVHKLFDRDNVAWMRHSAAKKLSQRLQQPHLQHTTAERPVLSSQDSTSGLSSSMHSLNSSDGVISLPDSTSPSYTLTRVPDLTREEENLAHVELSKWATDLQRSLQNERERYAALSRADRAVWLTERLSECVLDGSLVPVSQTPEFCGLRPGSEKAGGELLTRRTDEQIYQTPYPDGFPRLSKHDPLGVVWWTDDLKRRGWAIVQIVSSVGVVGGMAIWLARTCGLPSRSMSEWYFHWCGTSC